MILGALLAGAVTVLPVDRLAMADRLYGRGEYAEAHAEYAALKRENALSTDELLYRMAECDRALGRKPEARAEYGELLDRFPTSRYAPRARLMRAMAGTDAEKIRELPVLDDDRTEASIRAAALYHLGMLKKDPETLKRCARVEPKGRYAEFADFNRAEILLRSSDPAARRTGTEILTDIALGKSPLAERALYHAAAHVFDEKRHDEAATLFLRFLKAYPRSSEFESARRLAAWSCHYSGRQTEAIALCGDGKTDDLAYVRASATLSAGDTSTAAALFADYLDRFPGGKYAKSAELPMQRIRFAAAEKAGDFTGAIAAARRAKALSGVSGDAMRLAWAYERTNRVEEAKAEYDGVARTWPGTEDAAEAKFRSALIDVRGGKWAAAELALAEALAAGGKLKHRAAALYWRGLAAVQLGHDEDGVKFLREALGLGLGLDEKREARLTIADVDLRAGREEEAKAAYAELVRAGACDRMSAARILTVGRMLGPAEAKICARALAASDSAGWRQAGWQLLGSAQEGLGEYSAAVESYRRCLAEKARTDVCAAAALQLGKLECRSGEYAKAEVTLRRAVELNGENVRARAEAYLALAGACEGKGDYRNAKAYATLVAELFDDARLCAAARKLLNALKERPE